jgi:hypothetical protein
MGVPDGKSEGDKGMIIFTACPDDDISIEMAKKYIFEKGYTNETARIFRRDGVICVQIK